MYYIPPDCVFDPEHNDEDLDFDCLEDKRRGQLIEEAFRRLNMKWYNYIEIPDWILQKIYLETDICDEEFTYYYDREYKGYGDEEWNSED